MIMAKPLSPAASPVDQLTSSLPESAVPAQGEPKLCEALQLQGRVIWALILREALTRYGRRNIGVLWLFVEPMIFIIVISAIWSGIKGGSFSNVPIVAMMLTGYSTVLLWRNIPGRCINAVQINAPLLYHRQVKPLDIYIARTILEIVGASVSFAVLAFLFTKIEAAPPPEDLLRITGGWLLMIWFATSLGLLLGALSQRSDLVEKFWGPTTFVLFALSGMFFMLETMPPAVRTVLLWIPTVNCVELIREGYFGSGHTFYYDLPYVATFNTVLFFIALLQVRYITKFPTT
jgi:capsular polysaccharide transport system permease protein